MRLTYDSRCQMPNVMNKFLLRIFVTKT